MDEPPHLPAGRHVWLLPVLLVVVLAGHAVILYYGSLRVVLSTVVLSGAIILLVIGHVGVLGPVHGLFRRRLPRSRR